MTYRPDPDEPRHEEPAASQQPAVTTPNQDADAKDYDPFIAGMDFGDKEIKRVKRERQDPPYLAPSRHLGAGVTYDEYGQRVMDAEDPFAELNREDRKTYAPPSLRNGS